MEPIKFRYVTRHKASGNIEIKHYSLYQIEQGGLYILSPAFHADYEILSRDMYTGLKDSSPDDSKTGGSLEIHVNDILYDVFAGDFYRVDFDENYAMFFLKFLHGNSKSPLDRNFEEFDVEVGNDLYVVGNVFQNQNLLEATK
ncbi:hypothetical protein [Jeotgalibacillus haloalkalitolerans]|uniref:YopX protein domain-containing protein n=1 Tax=Jeotgalibacillus haloalkalitolerans TaxID=3104292 RepID=A0ABU5KK38_9BACL|nr:hypothetical protein [Jeotgalibacillus sp. HH7-29]MDZ5711622.1 hypothetical protein [Jeotgalibacillus sp. HH7-29]